MKQENKKLIMDAVHGDIELSPLEKDIINQPVFQRLEGIKQLGLTYKVYRTAHHTRFDHSLGTLHTATLIMNMLRKNGKQITSKQEKVIRCAALLHDLPHLPFGHTLEDEGNLVQKHEERFEEFITDTKIEDLLKNNGIFNGVMSILTNDEGESKNSSKSEVPLEPYMKELIGNTICADILDYIERDSYFTGLPLSYDDRIYQAFEVGKDGHLVLRLYDEHNNFLDDRFYSIIKILKDRFDLTRQVYYHHTKVKLDALLIASVSFALDDGLKEKDLFEITNFEMLSLLENKYEGKAGELAKRVRNRDLFPIADSLGYEEFVREDHPTKCKPIASQLNGDWECRYALEREIEENLGLSKGSVIVFCPESDMHLKPVETRVIWRDGEIRKLSVQAKNTSRAAIRNEIKNFKDAYKNLWNFYLLVHPKYYKNKVMRTLIIRSFREKIDEKIEKLPSQFQESEIFDSKKSLKEHLKPLINRRLESDEKNLCVDRVARIYQMPGGDGIGTRLLSELKQVPQENLLKYIKEFSKAARVDVEERNTEERFQEYHEKAKAEIEKDDSDDQPLLNSNEQ